MDFKELVEQRRSANNFLDGVELTEVELKEIFNDVKYAPSAFNLQHVNYIVVLDQELKNKINDKASGQYKIKTASALIFVVGNRYAYKDVRRLNEGMVNLRVITESELEELVQYQTAFYEERGEQFMKDEAIRNASLSAMFFMLAAKNRGWDTCPMIGFDSEKVRELLAIPQGQEPVLMITIGKEKIESRRLRGYRKPVDEFVQIIK